jgi:hypothetical protein
MAFIIIENKKIKRQFKSTAIIESLNNKTK